MSRRKIAILGSTGSVGQSAIDVCLRAPERFEIVALAAGGNVDRLLAQIAQVRPRLVSVKDDAARSALLDRLAGTEFRPEVQIGSAGACAVATAGDLVVCAIVGAAGLAPALAAARAGKTLALANKESLVVAGHLLTHEATRNGALLLPIDSEHASLHQALAGRAKADIRKLVLTASGGPFLRAPIEEVRNASIGAALAHPTWRMGAKISIDSATLMNKGFEVIEACHLFAMPLSQVEIVVHPESVVHGIIELTDGSMLAHLSVNDMRLPVAYALAYPERIDLGLPRLDLCAIGALHFEAPDPHRFPAYRLAYDAFAVGGVAPAVLNAADEIAVDAFLAGRLRFGQIAELLAETLDSMAPSLPGDGASLEALLVADAWARGRAQELVTRLLQ